MNLMPFAKWLDHTLDLKLNKLYGGEKMVMINLNTDAVVALNDMVEKRAIWHSEQLKILQEISENLKASIASG